MCPNENYNYILKKNTVKSHRILVIGTELSFTRVLTVLDTLLCNEVNLTICTVLNVALRLEIWTHLWLLK